MAVFILTQLSQQATFSIEKLFAHKFLLSVKLEIWPGQPYCCLMCGPELGQESYSQGEGDECPHSQYAVYRGSFCQFSSFALHLLSE